jgi:hypothetical protein
MSNAAEVEKAEEDVLRHSLFAASLAQLAADSSLTAIQLNDQMALLFSLLGGQVWLQSGDIILDDVAANIDLDQYPQLQQWLAGIDWQAYPELLALADENNVIHYMGLDALVTERPNGYLAVKYGDLQWVIIEAIQEMWSKVQEYFTRTEQLEEEVETLKAENDSFKARFEALEGGSDAGSESADVDESAASEDEPAGNLDDEPASDDSADDEDTEDTATTTLSTNATSTTTPGIDPDPAVSDPTATTTPELSEGTDPEPDPVVTEPPVAEPEVPVPTAEESTTEESSATSSGE